MPAELQRQPIADITSAGILDVLQGIEESGRREAAHSVRSFIGAVFRFAIATLRAEADPTWNCSLVYWLP